MSTKKKEVKISEHLKRGSRAALPVALVGAVLISSAYVIDIAYIGSAEAGVGETSAVARFLYELGSLIVKLIFPVLSGGIAMSMGGLSALSAGIIGGMLAGIGSTLSYPSGDSAAISGIFGSLAAGLTAGYSVIILNRLSQRQKGNMKYLKDMMLPVAPIILTVTAVLAINPLANIIYVLTETALAAVSRVNFILVAIMVGVMMTVDVGGPLYLSAYVFGAASIATGDPEIMASVMAAGMIPPLSLALCAGVFKDKFSKKERQASYVSMLCGITGVTHVAIPYYSGRPLRIVPPCVIGGVAASVLSMVFGCSVSLPVGGFLILGTASNPLYFLLSVLCGTFITAAIMGVTLRSVETTEVKAQRDLDTIMQGAA